MIKQQTCDTGATVLGHRPTPEVLRDWMVGYCANTLGTARESIDPNMRFDQLGMESMMLVIMTEELEKNIGQEIDPASPYDYSTINQLASHIAQLASKSASRTESKAQ